MRFNIDDYPGDYAMHCKTLREARSFLAHLVSLGRTWNGGESYLGCANWSDKHEEETAYAFNEGRYANFEWYKNHGYQILEWSDFIYDTPCGRIDDRNDYSPDLITIMGLDWFKLPEENGVIPIVAKDRIDNMEFHYTSLERHNNFAQSTLLSTLQDFWLTTIERVLGADNVMEFETDLTSVYGEITYGSVRSKISIPTWGMYKKHLNAFRKHIHHNENFWTATPWTTINENNVCIIGGREYVGAKNPRYSYAIHPVLYIKAEALTQN